MYWVGWLILAAVPLAVKVCRDLRTGFKNTDGEPLPPALTRYAPIAASIAVGIVPLIVLERGYDVPRKLMLGYGFLAYKRKHKTNLIPSCYISLSGLAHRFKAELVCPHS
jgi:hypothetical protein